MVAGQFTALLRRGCGYHTLPFNTNIAEKQAFRSLLIALYPVILLFQSFCLRSLQTRFLSFPTTPEDSLRHLSGPVPLFSRRENIRHLTTSWEALFSYVLLNLYNFGLICFNICFLLQYCFYICFSRNNRTVQRHRTMEFQKLVSHTFSTFNRRCIERVELS